MRAASPVLMVRTARELACHHRGRQHLQVRRLDEVQLPLQLRPQHRIATVARGSQPPAKLAHGELLGLLQRLPPARNAAAQFALKATRMGRVAPGRGLRRTRWMSLNA
jgi:hypothetical protein